MDNSSSEGSEESIACRNAASPVTQAARAWFTGAVTPRKESSVLKRLAILFMAVGMLMTVVMPAVAAERAVLAELFGADW